MFSSVEVRVPYLSLPLVKYVKSLPANNKVGIFTGKKLLKKIGHNKLPKYIIQRPKTSFTLPIRSILFDEKDWVISNFLKTNPLFESYFRMQNVKNYIIDYFNFNHDNNQVVFTLLQLKILFDSLIEKYNNDI